MTMVIAIVVAVTFGVSIYLMLGRELKGVAMGVFLLGHAANLSILAMSGSPVNTEEQQAQLAAMAEQAPQQAEDGEYKDAAITPIVDKSPEMKDPPVLPNHDPMEQPLALMADPLPQALILTAIVIGFGVMAFLLTLLVVTVRSNKTLEVGELAGEAPEA